MDDFERGKVRNPARNAQTTDWSGVRYGLVTPTDVDGLIEYRNEVFVLYELKLVGTDMPRGQRTALERLVDALVKAGKRAVLFKCEHDTYASDEIDAACSLVTEVYLGNGTRRAGCGRSLKKETDDFLRYAPVQFGEGEEPQWS